MFGKRKTVPATPEIIPVSAPARVAPKSPSEFIKPVAAPPPPPRRVRRPRGGLLSLLSGLLTLGLVVGAAFVFGLLVIDREVGVPGPLAADKVVLIPKGSGTSDIAELLNREGVIANPTLFEIYAYLSRSKGQLKAGEFQFKAGANIDEAIETLIGGKAILHALTVPEGLTSEQIVERLRENDILVGAINEIPREGSLMPDTYRFERGTTRQQVVNLMSAAQREALAKAWGKRAPDLPIRTAPELVILASIVEKETGRADERGRVAGVFLNRLQKRMKLQSDPTIVYGLVGGKGTLGRGILRSEIERATPYNTYVIEGLPPGPIANPGRAALEAAANPVKSRDIFFVADGTGGHAFAETLDQHNRNVARWRSVERAREAASGAVDKAEPPALPETRTDLGPGTRVGLAYEGSQTGATPRSAAFDAVEGTARDPLRNQNWDLNSPKSVPSFGPEPVPAARGRSRRAAPRPKGEPPARTLPRDPALLPPTLAEAPRMALRSMTGFAREAGVTGARQWAWELKTVNGRGLDIRVRTPPGFDGLGEEARRAVAASLSRGQCQLTLTVTSTGGEPAVRVNREALASLLSALSDLDLPTTVRPASLDGLLAVRGVVTVEDEGSDEAFDAALAADIGAASSRLVAALGAARAAEGGALSDVILRQLADMERLVSAAEAAPGRTPEAVRARLAAQVAALTETGLGLDPGRLHAEAALLATRADIREELDRLRAHLAAARELLESEAAVGRRLDFLAQEFGRETNTLCSKANDIALSRIGLELKAVVEQFREQVQNVE